MPHSSVSTGVPPSDVTASMIVSAPCLRARSASALASDCTPVDVSACTNARILASGLALSASSTFCGSDRRAPAIVDDDGDAAASLHVLDHPAAENAVAAHDDLVAGIDHVDEAHFHSHRPGSGDRKSQRVVRLERVAQRLLQLLHHFDEHRVEVADRRLAHCRKHARMDLRGPGSHQVALRRIERRDLLLGCVILA